jgi:hypothetical protein
VRLSPKRSSAVIAILLASSVLAAAPATEAGAATPSTSWSKSLATWSQTSSPTIADVNGDGQNDVVFGADDGVVRVLNGNGANVPGWPQRAGVAIDGAISVADLDGDGAREVIVPMGSLGVRNQHGGVKVFNRNGSLRCVVNTRDTFNQWTGGPPDGFRDAVKGAPAIGDVSGDGRPDIVFGSYDHYMYAVNRHCQSISGFPRDMRDTLWPSPALFDLNGDGKAEIFMGIDTSPGPGSQPGGALVALEHTGFGVRELWRRVTNEVVYSSPAMSDINGDGKVDVVFGTGLHWKGSDAAKVFAVQASNGRDLPGWPVHVGGQTYPSPAIGDVNGDGRPDVVAANWQGNVAAFAGSGRRLWNRNLGNNASVGSPIIADMNGDGHNDVGVGNVGAFRILDGRNGVTLSAVNKGYSFWSAGAVGKFGNQWKVVSIGFRAGSYHDSRVVASNIPAPKKTPPWPQFSRNAAHTGAPSATDKCRRSLNPVAKPSTKSSKGYWVVTTTGGVHSLQAPFYGSASSRLNGGVAIAIRPAGSSGYYVLTSKGAIIPFGTAKSRGSMVGRRLNGAIIGMASTPSGKGYWLLGSDGGIFTFGDAKFYGSTGNKRLSKPIIAMAATKSGRGYWLLGSDGGVFTFGDAQFKGSTGAKRLSAPIISMATAPSGKGYWLVGKDGGIFSFGVPFYGSLPGIGLCQTPRGVQIRPTLTGKGYYVLSPDGRVFPFGDAYNRGSVRGLSGWNFAMDLAVRP